MGFYPTGCTDNGAPLPPEEEQDDFDRCECCHRLVDGLGEAYAHDDESDRLCQPCIQKLAALAVKLLRYAPGYVGGAR